MCRLAYKATLHDEAHGAFMTLPQYTRIKDDEAPQLDSGPKPCRVGKCREEMSSGVVRRGEAISMPGQQISEAFSHQHVFADV